MGERKVLNKYYPPDFDPAAIPRMKRPKDLQMKVRMMLPMTIQCKTCGSFIYKGTKFNSRKEDVVGEVYLGIQVFRFYFKCTRCAAELTIKTDPQNSDYAVEHGAKRTAEPWRDEEKQLAEEKAKRDKEEMGDAMRALENKTLDSRQEMDILAALDEMRSLKSRHFHVSTEDMLGVLQQRRQAEAGTDLTEEDEAVVRSIFRKSEGFVRRLEDDDEEEDGDEERQPVGGAGPSADASTRGRTSASEQREGKQVEVEGQSSAKRKAKRRPAAPLPVSAQLWDDEEQGADDSHDGDGNSEQESAHGVAKRPKGSGVDGMPFAGSGRSAGRDRQGGGEAAEPSSPPGPAGELDGDVGDVGGTRLGAADGAGGPPRAPPLAADGARDASGAGAGPIQGARTAPASSATGFLETSAVDAAGSKVATSSSDVSFAVKSRPVMFAVKQKPGQGQVARQPVKQQVSLGVPQAKVAQPPAASQPVGGGGTAPSGGSKLHALGSVLASYGSDEDSPSLSS